MQRQDLTQSKAFTAWAPTLWTGKGALLRHSPRGIPALRGHRRHLMPTSLSVGTRLRGGIAGSHRDRVATHNFPRNTNLTKASWIRRGGKCWRCLWVELQNTRHPLRTPRIAGKKFAMGCRSLWMHQDRSWKKWLLCSCYPLRILMWEMWGTGAIQIKYSWQGR